MDNTMMPSKLLPLLKYRDILYLAIIIAALILLKQCGNERDAYAQEAAAAKDLLAKQGQDIIETNRQLWQYRNDTATVRYERRQAARREDSIQRIVRGKESEIKKLYALLREPWPETPADSIARYQAALKCCGEAEILRQENESYRAVDSIKEAAYMGEIDISTRRIDSLQNQLQRSFDRFNSLDSLRRIAFKASKPRAKISAGDVS